MADGETQEVCAPDPLKSPHRGMPELQTLNPPSPCLQILPQIMSNLLREKVETYTGDVEAPKLSHPDTQSGAESERGRHETAIRMRLKLPAVSIPMQLSVARNRHGGR